MTPGILERAKELRASALDGIRSSTDRLLARLLVVHWVAAIVVSLVVSPRTWIGDQSEVHLHVMVSIGAGLPLAIVPFFFARRMAGQIPTRHVLAASLMLWSVLFIHLSGGRIETHFHIFASLVILTLYRDWRVLASATLLIAVDHAVRGVWWPQSVFGIVTESPYRWIEHALWVLFEVAFLLLLTQRSMREMDDVAHKRAIVEDESRTKQEIIRAFYESTPLLMGVVDVVDDDILHISDNPATARFFGRSAEELSGKFASELGVPKEVRTRWVRYYRRSEDSLQPCSFEYQHGSDSDPRWFSVTVAYIGPGNEGRSRHSYVIQDVTVLKLQMIELESARKQAEGANCAKTEFLANMSHELRTPLNAILGFADMMSELSDDPEAQEHARETIERNGQHLLQVINDILDVSKLEAGRVDVESIEFSPRELVAEIRAASEVRASEKGLEVRVDVTPEVPDRASSDPTRLRQVLHNLVSNAVKFSESGVIGIEVSHDAARSELSFAVADQGIGMEPAAAARVFEPFVQADTSMTRRFGGTGLGLPISRRLARLLGGDLVVRSEPSRGSRFTLTIPVEVTSGSAVSGGEGTPAESSSERSPARTKGELAGIRVLYAEDGPDNRRLVEHLLGRAGAEIVLVEDGSEALSACLESEEMDQPFDVVLMDMQMPVLDGYAATRALRSRGYDRPIVALTAHAFDHDRARCLEAGCDDFQPKPIRKPELIRCIRTLADGGRSAAGRTV